MSPIPRITDTPPRSVQDELTRLRSWLDETVPRKELDHNLLIATWNVRALGGLTHSWSAGSGDSPKRDLRALRVIAEIVSRFDVIAIQEAKSELTAIRDLLRALGQDHWGMIITDVTAGTAGNRERLAFVYDRRRVNPSGLACELVVPMDASSKITLTAFEDQFARTPYAVSFVSETASFILVTLHVKFGQSSAGRVPELESIAQWLADWAALQHAFDDNIIALGDFNIDRRLNADDSVNELYAAFTSSGLHTPDDMNDLPRTIFGSGIDRFYDQIAWFDGEQGAPSLSLTYAGGGYVDFPSVVYRKPDDSGNSITKNSLSWRVSDHYPLWAEFLLPA